MITYKKAGVDVDAGDALVDRIKKRRLVTLSGPGGIGKTSVALTVAQSLQHSFEDGVILVDLGAAAPSAEQVPFAT